MGPQKIVAHGRRRILRSKENRAQKAAIIAEVQAEYRGGSLLRKVSLMWQRSRDL